MVEGRVYRAALLPLVLALLIVAFSFGDRPAPLRSPLAPDLFDGAHAMQTLTTLAQRFPARRPGSAGDDALARYVAAQLAHPMGPGVTTVSGQSTAPAFTVATRRRTLQTIDGRRSVAIVTARRPGADSGQIVVVAHRDAAARGSEAELSGTAALLELAGALAGRVTNRPLTLMSTSAGTGGDIAAAELAHSGGPVDAVIVLGDLAGARARSPFVIGWSNGRGSAPDLLQRTARDALSHQLGIRPATPSIASQVAHLALPFAIGEQGALNQAGLPAVLLQASGEQGPTAAEPVSARRLGNFGRAALATVNALDASPRGVGGPSSDLHLQSKYLPAWAIRVLVAALLFPALLATVDALARARRRRAAIGRVLRRLLAGALALYLCALVAVGLSLLGVIAAAPATPTRPADLPLHGADVVPTLLLVGALALAFRVRTPLLRMLERRLGLAEQPPPQGRPRPRLPARGEWLERLRHPTVEQTAADGTAGVALMVALCALALVLWVADPYAALLLVPAAHLWLTLANAPGRSPRLLGVLVLALGLAPVLAVIALYAHQLGMSAPQLAWTGVLLVAGGHIGVLSAALWSVGAACAGAALVVVLRRGGAEPAPEIPITVRGPIGYAGPGSLGGTRSALRR